MQYVTLPDSAVNVAGLPAAVPCDNPTIVIATAKNGKTKCHDRYRSTWIEFAESFQPALTTPKQSKDVCPIFVFAALDGPEITDGYYSGVPVQGFRRVADNALARFGLTIDFDNADTTFQAVVDRVRALGLTAVVNSSYNHLKTITKPRDGQLIEAALAEIPAQLKPHIVGKEVHHLPWPKIHVVIPFKQEWLVPREPVRVADNIMAQRAKDGLAPYKLTVEGHRLN